MILYDAPRNVGSGGDVYTLPVVPERKSVYVTN